MLNLPDETVVEILAVLPYVEITNCVVRVCRSWRALRTSEHFSATRAAVDERGLVVAGGVDATGRWSQICHVLVGGRWLERASMPCEFGGHSIMFCGQLVLIGDTRDESDGQWSPCCLAFNLETNAWRTLEWEGVGGDVGCCCTTGAVIVALSRVWTEVRARLRSLRPGSTEGWVPIPDPPVDVLASEFTPSLCFVEDVLYVVGGADASGAAVEDVQAYDLSTRAWTVCSPLPEALADNGCVEIAGRLYVVGGDLDGGFGLRAEVFSYDPRTDRWSSESLLPIENYRETSRSAQLTAVSHEGRVVVIGIEGAPPLALVDDVWTELPRLPPTAGAAHMACPASLLLR